MLNNQSLLDVRKLMTGKDGRLYVKVKGVSILLAEVDTFQVQMSVTNTDYQPVGSILSYAVPTSVNFTLTFTEAVIRDDVIMQPLLAAVKSGKILTFDFSGANKRSDGKEQRITFNNCTPDGAFDLMNLQPGDIIKRQHSFRINSIPEYIKKLAS